MKFDVADLMYKRQELGLYQAADAFIKLNDDASSYFMILCFIAGVVFFFF